MPFGVIWAREAEEDLARIADRYPLSDSLILDHIDKLAEDPAALSRRPSFPHPLLPKSQVWVNTDTGRLFVTVLFRYLPGEREIEIRAIGFISFEDE